jgi:toxin ParE1/3/4
LKPLLPAVKTNAHDSLPFTPKAREDLESIADFTLEKWGIQQEQLYLRLLKQAFGFLSDNPYLGHPMSKVMPGLRRLLAGSHIILYFVADTHVDVVRILHHSMDILRHIESE